MRLTFCLLFLASAAWGQVVSGPVSGSAGGSGITSLTGDVTGSGGGAVATKAVSATGPGGFAVTYGVSAGSITVPGTVITSTTAIFNGGNVGIGTSGPGAKLDVAGAARVSGSGAGLQICDRTDSSCNSTWYSPSNTDIRLNTASGDVFTIQNGGNVGLNTTTPGSTLDVNGDETVRGQLTVANSSVTIGGDLGITSSSAQCFENNAAAGQGFCLDSAVNNNALFTKGYRGIQFESYNGTAYVPVLTVTGAGAPGNVGIGTASPTHLFQVGGGTLSVTSNGHLSTTGSAPAIGACGTTPSLAANSDDTAGVINTGTGVFTSCAITFSNAYTNAPSCFCIDQTTTLAVRATPTNTGLTCAGTFTASDVLSYICLGRSE